jgi:hypothetical protein
MIKFLKNHYHTRYHGQYQHAKKLFVFDLALLFTAVVMLAGSVFLFFWKPSLVGMIDMSISLGGERIKSGEQVQMTVNFTNRSKQKLIDVSLSLKLPEGFIIDRNKTPSETFSDHSIFTHVKEIAAGASGQVEVYGQLWLEPKKEERIIANLSYRPENKTDREQKFSSLLANLSESVLTSALDFPSSTFANSPVKFTYTLKNTSDQKIENISLINNWSKNIIKDKDSLKISLPSGASKTIEGQITSPDRSGDYTFTITPQVLANNHSISQSSASQNFKVLVPQIDASARLTDQVAYGEPGQMIPIEVSWENKSNFKLENISLHLTASLAGVVDWKRTAIENHAKFETSGIYFDQNSRTSLSSGAPNNPDTFRVNLYLLKTFGLSGVEKARLEIYPIVKAGSGELAAQQFTRKGSSTGFPLTTEVRFSNIEARYYTDEGDQLGRGPLPPKVDKTTKYWVFVKIINTSNVINDTVFRTSLPEGVEFTGKQSTTIGPQLKYNPADHSISWEYYTLPANSKTGLYFEVAVTPNSSQVGQNIRLTNSLSFSATDEFIGKKFNLTQSPVTNLLNTNDDGYGMGSKVVQ